MTSPVNEGDVLAGKYRVERTLGVGGMGVVVAARHIQLEDQVALKFLLPAALEDPLLVERFQREARAAVKIKGEHVAKVLDVGTMDNGAPYMVMEFLRGGDLEQLLAHRGTLPVDEAVDYIMQAAEAMAEAHALGIVHRDLKPANLFLSQRADGTPIVKVLDFGISKALNPGEDASVTKTTAVMGSPLYMSPEQLRASRNVDARTDIWSLGVILYELLHGSPPFLAPTMPQLCAVILAEPPMPINPDLPEGVIRALERCLEKDVDKRYPSVAAFTADIVRFGLRNNRSNFERIQRISEAAGVQVSGVDWSAATLVGDSVAPVGRSTSTAWSESNPAVQSTSNANLPPVAPPKSRAKLAGAAVAVLGLLAVGAFVGLRGNETPPAAAAPVEAPVAVVAPVAPAPGDKRIAVSIASDAPGAKIFIDNVEVGNPFKSELKSDGELHTVRVEAADFVTRSQGVVFDKDLDLKVALDEAPAPEPAGGGKKAPSSTKKKKEEAKPAAPQPSGLRMMEHL